MADEQELTPEQLEQLRQLLIRQAGGVDPTVIERTTMNNIKDLEAGIGGILGSAGPGTSNPAAFDPTVSYEDQVLPTRLLYKQFESAPQGSIEGAIRDAFAENPNSPSQAMSTISQTLLNSEFPDWLIPGDTGVMEGKPGQAPNDPDKASKARYDARMKEIRGIVDDLYSEGRTYESERAQLAPEAQAALDAGQSTYSKEILTPSKAAQKYYDEGLSLPTDRYQQSQFFSRGEDAGAAKAKDARDMFMSLYNVNKSTLPTAGLQADAARYQAQAPAATGALATARNDLQAWAKRSANNTAAPAAAWMQDTRGWSNADQVRANMSVAGRQHRDDIRDSAALLQQYEAAGRTPLDDQLRRRLGAR